MPKDTILVIDDEPMLRHVLCRALERDGWVTLEAADGVDALEICRNEQPDAVVLDLLMPRKEGLQTLVELRRALPDISVIAMSGAGKLSAVDVLGAAIALGATETLAKPFKMADAVAAARRTRRIVSH